MRSLYSALVLALSFSSVSNAQRTVVSDLSLPFAPLKYVSYRAPEPLTIDGKLDETTWQAAPWTEYFQDIEGPVRPAPAYRTRAKMLWDDEYFYVAAELEEPHVWATITERDAVVYYDNDFEVFIDPDGDTHAYYEMEVNALKTAWDLLMLQPYRDGGRAIDAWDIAGLQMGVDIVGTLNQPDDRDEKWTVEIAMPWSILSEAAPGGRPEAGDQWRVNFSRVQWQLDVKDGAYVKRINPATNRPFPEDNWVWSPQGGINMHMPERWGIVQFSGIEPGMDAEMFRVDLNERVKWALRQLYYKQRTYRQANGRYASTLEELDPGFIQIEGLQFQPTLEATTSLYEITAPGFDDKTVHIRQDGKVWVN